MALLINCLGHQHPVSSASSLKLIDKRYALVNVMLTILFQFSVKVVAVGHQTHTLWPDTSILCFTLLNICFTSDCCSSTPSQHNECVNEERNSSKYGTDLTIYYIFKSSSSNRHMPSDLEHFLPAEIYRPAPSSPKLPHMAEIRNVFLFFFFKLYHLQSPGNWGFSLKGNIHWGI